ncbi:hypothetical protein [Allgaiera indica]|uniref:hypothetical protein n=1 Tax=Allgaiera indica TaxID=765699 RepID=UPI00115FB0B5|nr:hypothetical protein [Allgaiera indica]
MLSIEAHRAALHTAAPPVANINRAPHLRRRPILDTAAPAVVGYILFTFFIFSPLWALVASFCRWLF